MSLNIGDNFSYLGAKPLDTRRVAINKAALDAMNLSTVYEGMIAYAKAEDKYYRLKNNVWAEFASGSGISSWTSSKAYAINDIVINSGTLYICTTAHTSGTSFDDTEKANWQEVGSGGAGITDWTSAKEYKVGDIVYYNNSLFKCNSAHTSSSTFNTDESNWVLMYADLKLWGASKYYVAGTTVINSNILYRCKTSHTSGSSFDSTEQINWDIIGKPSSITEWEANTSYTFNQIVIYNGDFYKCITAHISGSTFDNDEQANWDEIIGGGTSIDNWVSGTNYVVGDFVLYHNKIYKCIIANADTNFTSTNWQEISGIYDYASGINYMVGELVVYNNMLYRCKVAYTSTATFDSSKWDVISEKKSNIENWASATSYNVGEVIIRENHIYRCNTAHTSGTSFDSTEEANWTKLDNIPGWASSKDYFIDDIVIYNNKIYTCDTAHTAASTFNATERANWTPLCTSVIKNWQASVTYDVDDVVLYNGSLFRCINTNTSSTFNASNFSLIASDLKLWSDSTNYVIGATVINDGLLYRCNTTHVSGSTFNATEKANWALIGKPCVYTWQSGHLYDVGDLISINGSMYRCITAHTASSTFSNDIANWALVYANISNWATNTYYPVGACVIYNGILYQCIVAHTSATTFANTNWSNVGGKEYVQPYEDTPIGTIISYMGKTAPEDYLVCDGTIYNISDYGDLADFINTQFGSYNFFGGDGTTTFAVPDLRGEFLRGSGTNSHTNQGNGSDVGVHQNATEDVTALIYNNNIFFKKELNAVTNVITSPDSMIKSSSATPHSMMLSPTVYNDSSVQDLRYTSRPTNTSVLYCIKYTNAPSMQPSNIYSTIEKRIGTWIDGKPIYQQTVQVVLPSTVSVQPYSYIPSIPWNTLDTLIGVEGTAIRSDGYTVYHGFNYLDENQFSFHWNKTNGNLFFFVTNKSSYSTAGQTAIMTFRYTKV